MLGSLIIAIIALLLAIQNRSSWKRTGEDIDEIRNSLYEFRTNLKSLRAEWNLKSSKLQIELMQAEGKIKNRKIPYYITKDCIACGSCIPECPVDAITEGTIFEINTRLCIACDKCAAVCPVNACVPVYTAEEMKKIAPAKTKKSTKTKSKPRAEKTEKKETKETEKSPKKADKKSKSKSKS